MTTNYALVLTLNYFFEIVNWLILIRVILSLLRMENMSNPISRFVITVTEPILEPFRRLQFKSSIGRNMMIDFSPILAMLVIQYIIRPIIINIVSLI
ncbi:YggT family protein [Thermoanaerobacterium thermosaccharolyticum]|uniref:YggT family protein n=1 Tax=Thermoanaerobacterium thermosaccharolyticum TaxID=1517 RepID=UPI00177FE8E3|nr:YggT family protein [Thermoanaerobacterium thermosaccharolyticum]MBE0067867.1 YggT family protein [Thermoanaerobacterium thermosaccharolyticum]MBE0227430.1 YggT family protein [Thermoanaerobacterium thermosaccharolyticum]